MGVVANWIGASRLDQRLRLAKVRASFGLRPDPFRLRSIHHSPFPVLTATIPVAVGEHINSMDA